MLGKLRRLPSAIAISVLWLRAYRHASKSRYHRAERALRPLHRRLGAFPTTEVHVWAQVMSAMVAANLGRSDTAVGHAEAARDLLGSLSRRFAPSERDYLIYYCRGVVEYVGASLGDGRQSDGWDLVKYSDLKLDEVPRHLTQKFPVVGAHPTDTLASGRKHTTSPL